MGILDADEQVKAIDNIQYRVINRQYAVEKVILIGKNQNFSVNVWGAKFNQHSMLQQIKGLTVKLVHTKEKGHITDQLNHRRYAYTDIYMLRKRDQDDLIHAYFNAGKLIALQYIVQC